MIYTEPEYKIPNEVLKTYPLLMTALTLIKIGHNGQSYNLLPYWHHPVRVMLRLNWYAVTADEIYAALFHDLLEDTCITERDLKTFGFSVTTIQIVQTVTRNKDEENYKEFIKRVIDSGCVSSMRLKLADLYENSNNVRFLPPEKRKIMVRYGKSIDEIQDMLSIYGKGSLLENTICGELDKNEVEKYIGEQPTFL